MNSSIAVILGSAFEKSIPEKLNLEMIDIQTGFGTQKLYKSKQENGRDLFVIFRHGLPHTILPNQINYRAQAAALKELNCGALLINSSVGVMDANLPLYKPMMVTDLLMPENRLPDGSTCTMFQKPSSDHGHLLIKDGLFSTELNQQILDLGGDEIYKSENSVVFVYAGGPRGKTPAENKMWAQLGGQVNSMTLAPEVVLANELEIPCAAVVVGHKYSVPGIENPQKQKIGDTLKQSRKATESLITKFLMSGKPVDFANQIYRF
ncbi:MAG TPA: hypothetical protein VKM36_09360 [Balneolaceae bacterium]|nr:hypothetical protein [Balneolaceae bacterium]